MNISVIIPTLNRSTLLSGTIISLLEQEFDKAAYEIIVVDNGSTDDTEQVVASIIKAYRDVSIKYIYEPRSGSVWARHAGAKAATFDILSFTDDDGLLSTCWLLEISRVFALDEKIAAVAGRISIRWDESPPSWVIPYEGLLGKLDYGENVLVGEGLFINSGNFSIRKDIFEDLKGFNPDLVGEWLIGDGETGLCHKLHARKHLIGWAPLAHMQHRQFVSKHASIDDIRRRFINNGIGVPYRLYAVDSKGIPGLLVNLVFAARGIFSRGLKSLFLSLRGDVDGKRRALFQMSFFLAQVPYTMKIFFSSNFRRELLRDYWSESG